MQSNQVYDGEWVDVTDGTVTACCDCGLVHVVEYTVLKGRILRRLLVDKVRTRYHRKTKSVKKSLCVIFRKLTKRC